ncbi:MAG: hypothetical protein GF375_06150 [Candidatus Omnitrophica bacterium]|nr:hypothetical protein [Candidatus Omnitrophota bacterium]MBD3269557.1 hypothetical protein [Candidatus Omnitrophota bacterium]
MKERRKYTRLKKVLPIKLSDEDFDILTETTNISAQGAYCPVNRPLEIMTRVGLVILLTLPKKNGTKKEVKTINCNGIVVRNEFLDENEKYPYRIAIYFNDITSHDRKLLDTYVKSHLNY